MMPQEGFTAAALSSRIEAFLSLPESLARAANYARRAGKINAAHDLAALAISTANKNKLNERTAAMKERAA